VLSSAFKIALKIVGEYWWILAPVALFFIFKGLWLDYIQSKFINNLKWSVLEIKFPKDVKKTPKAMEQIFAGFHGTEGDPSFTEKWFKGELPVWFSLEIIGRNGDIHFFIRTQEDFRNLVEAQIYAQYPDAEINEAEDYVTSLPPKIPSKDYDVWGTELILAKEDAYPIRTYPYFFEEAGKEEERVDPLASLSEVLNSVTPDEHIWIQILVSPTDDKWKEEAEKLVEKLIGKKVTRTPRGMMLEEVHGWAEALRETLHEFFFGRSEEKSSLKEKEKSLESLMQFLTPGQKDVVTAIEKNISKLGFKTLIRFIYWAKSDMFNSANKAAVIGSFKQFNTQNLNGFKSNKKIKPGAKFLFKNRRNFSRKLNLISNYKKRSFPFRSFSSRGFVFNTEELASIYHVPGRFVEAEALPRVEAKKKGPPSGLPTE